MAREVEGADLQAVDILGGVEESGLDAANGRLGSIQRADLDAVKFALR